MTNTVLTRLNKVESSTMMSEFSLISNRIKAQLNETANILDPVRRTKMILAECSTLDLDNADAPVRTFITEQERLMELIDMGLKNSLEKLDTKELHQSLPYLSYELAPFRNYFQKGYTDIDIISKMHSFLQKYLDSDTVSQIFDEVNEKYTKYKDDILLYESILALSGNRVYITLRNILEEAFLISESKKTLAKKLEAWAYMPLVKRILENYGNDTDRETKKIIAAAGKVDVSKLVSPVYRTANESIFFCDEVPYKVNKNGEISKLTELPKDEKFFECAKISSFLALPQTQIKKDGSIVYQGRLPITISTVQESDNLIELDREAYVKLKEGVISTKVVGFYNNVVSLETAGRIFEMNAQEYLNNIEFRRIKVGDREIVPMDGIATALRTNNIYSVQEGRIIDFVATLWKNLDNVMEISFADKIVSKTYEGVSFHIFETKAGTYVLENNKTQGILEFKKVDNFTQLSERVLQTIGYDLKEQYRELVDEETKQVGLTESYRKWKRSEIKNITSEIERMREIVMREGLEHVSELNAILEEMEETREELLNGTELRINDTVKLVGDDEGLYKIVDCAVNDASSPVVVMCIKKGNKIGSGKTAMVSFEEIIKQ